MIYKEKIESLLESLDGKLKVIANVANGSIHINAQELNTIISDCVKIKERIQDLISIER
jgi:hypothetical protein